MNRLTTKTAALALAAALLLGGCAAPGASAAAASATPEEQPGIKVQTAAPETGTLELTTAFVGSVQPEHMVSVLPEMPGTVTKVYVIPGQTVKKGDLLLTLDDSDMQLNYQQAEIGYQASMNQADQMLGYQFESMENQADQAFDSAQQAYEDAEWQMDVAEKDLKIAQEAVKADPTDMDAQAELAKARASYAIAEKTLSTTRKMRNNARSNYSNVVIDGKATTETNAETTRKMAEATLANAKSALAKTKLYAPIDGVVESVNATALNMVSNASPAFVISNKDALMVSFNVPSASIAAMQVGMQVEIEKGQTSYTGTISEVSTIVNQQTGLFTVKATLDETAPELLTGVMVKVTAPTKRAENALLLNQDSVYYDDGQAYVYLAADGYAKRQDVEVGISTPQQVEILSGVSAGDSVITTWHPNLADGVKLELAS